MIAVATAFGGESMLFGPQWNCNVITLHIPHQATKDGRVRPTTTGGRRHRAKRPDEIGTAVIVISRFLRILRRNACWCPVLFGRACFLRFQIAIARRVSDIGWLRRALRRIPRCACDLADQATPAGPTEEP